MFQDLDWRGRGSGGWGMGEERKVRDLGEGGLCDFRVASRRRNYFWLFSCIMYKNIALEMDFAITEPDWNGAQSIGDVLETEGERGGRQDVHMLYAGDDDPNGTPQSGDADDDDDDDESQLDKIVVSESELHRDDGDKKNKERNNDDEVEVGGVRRKDDVDDESEFAMRGRAMDGVGLRTKSGISGGG